MSFWKKFDEFRKQVNSVESNIYSSKRDFLEVYEKNIQLEAEIEERSVIATFSKPKVSISCFATDL